MNTPFTLHTKHPVADQSVDHLRPRGTKNDNSTNRAFNRKLLRFLTMPGARVLDLGCSGGGFVESLLEDDVDAFGIEGSDYSKHIRREAWGHIPHRLGTADIAKPFLLMRDSATIEFDAVTAWEVLEHIAEADLETLNANILLHTHRLGLFIGSVNTVSDKFQGVEYHATIRPWEWWQSFFVNRGWIWDLRIWESLNPDWVRGPYTDGAGSHPFVFRKR